jgi:hypothetical protein
VMFWSFLFFIHYDAALKCIVRAFAGAIKKPETARFQNKKVVPKNSTRYFQCTLCRSNQEKKKHTHCANPPNH